MEEYFLGLGDEFSADNTLYGGLFKSYTFPSPKLPSDLKPAPTNILLVTFPTVLENVALTLAKMFTSLPLLFDKRHTIV